MQIANSFQHFTIIVKSFILDVQLGYKCLFEYVRFLPTHLNIQSIK